MDAKLLKLVQDALSAFGNGMNTDSARLGTILPAAMGIGMNGATIATAFGGLLEHYHHQQLLDRCGPTATMLRQRARVGAALLRHAGAQFYEATIDNSPKLAEAAITSLSPFRTEHTFDLTKTLQALLVPYIPSLYSQADAPVDEVHAGFNLFTVQPLQYDLGEEASPRGNIAFAKSTYTIQLCFRDAGGSKRSLQFCAGNHVYSLTSTVYDALEDTTYPGNSTHFTAEELQSGLESVFTAAGWSKAAYEADRWTAQQWTQGFRNVRYVGAEPEPLTNPYDAKTLGEMRYGSKHYCEWVTEDGALHWILNAHDLCFQGTLRADETAEAPSIFKLGRYESIEGPWAIHPHCLPDLLVTLMEYRDAYLTRLKEYRARTRTLSGISIGDDDD